MRTDFPWLRVNSDTINAVANDGRRLALPLLSDTTSLSPRHREYNRKSRAFSYVSDIYSWTGCFIRRRSITISSVQHFLNRKHARPRVLMMFVYHTTRMNRTVNVFFLYLSFLFYLTEFCSICFFLVKGRNGRSEKVVKYHIAGHRYWNTWIFLDNND